MRYFHFAFLLAALTGLANSQTVVPEELAQGNMDVQRARISAERSGWKRVLQPKMGLATTGLQSTAVLTG